MTTLNTDPDLEEISAKDLVGLIQLKRIIGAGAQSDQIVAELYEGVADVARARASFMKSPLMSLIVILSAPTSGAVSS